MQTKQLFTLVTVLVIVTNLVAPVWAQRDKKIQQSEKEFERLMPITGTVETSFGKFEVDHSFPTKETSERIYDLMDYSRAALSVEPADHQPDPDALLGEKFSTIKLAATS